jgi:hypothetical protein
MGTDFHGRYGFRRFRKTITPTVREYSPVVSSMVLSVSFPTYRPSVSFKVYVWG